MAKQWWRAALIAAVATLAVASAAHAQYPPAQKPTLVISQEIGPPGYTFTATVTNCVPGQLIVFVVGDQRVETACDPVTLQASATLTAPPGLGSYTVFAEFYGDCSPFVQGLRSDGLTAQAEPPCLVLSETIQVVAATPTTTTTTVPTGTIPTSGSNGVDSLVTAGVILVITGFGIFAVSRVRRRPVAA
jgi:hypothetical protein